MIVTIKIIVKKESPASFIHSLGTAINMINEKYGMEDKEATFIFLTSFAIFYLIFIGLIYRNCFFPHTFSQELTSSLSSIFVGVLFFSAVSYLSAVISCVLYTDFKMKA